MRFIKDGWMSWMRRRKAKNLKNMERFVSFCASANNLLVKTSFELSKVVLDVLKGEKWVRVARSQKKSSSFVGLRTESDPERKIFSCFCFRPMENFFPNQEQRDEKEKKEFCNWNVDVGRMRSVCRFSWVPLSNKKIPPENVDRICAININWNFIQNRVVRARVGAQSGV